MPVIDLSRSIDLPLDSTAQTGELADAVFLRRSREKFLETRNPVIKGAAESERWRRHLEAN